MSVLSRNPQFSVRVVSERLGSFEITDTHDSVISIETMRQLGNAAGGFQISLVPRRIIAGLSGQWVDALGAMDYVDLSIWIPPNRAPWPLFRGFIDSVGITEQFGGPRVQRIVTIAGRDYGKLLLNAKLFFPTAPLQAVALFQKWQDAYTELFGDLSALPPERQAMGATQEADGPNFTPSMLQRVIFEKFYQPQEAEVLNTFEIAQKPPGLTLVIESDQWEPRLRAYNPAFFQKGLAPWSDIWTLMYSYQHRPWRELLIREGIDAPELIYRPCPWLSKEGEWVQGAPGQSVRTWEVTPDQIVSRVLGRSDAQVLNYFMSFPEQFAMLGIMAKTMGNQEGVFLDPLRNNPFLVGYGDLIPTNPGAMSLTSRFQRFGFRIGEFSTPYLSMSRGIKEEQVQLKMADIREQGAEGNRRVRLAMDHNHLLSSGQLTLRGDPTIQAGDYIHLSDYDARFYVEGVRHEVRVAGNGPGESRYITVVQVSRGRDHLRQHWGLPG